MRAAVAAVEEAEGAVGALVNNAGYSQSGAVETIPLDEVRRQFETNVFGLVRMCQLVLPGMRRAGRGRIVNISSMGGKLVFPGGGVYHATKFAVEAISDAMRFEVRGFGVHVSVIEPGLIKTQLRRDRRRLRAARGRALRGVQHRGRGEHREASTTARSASSAAGPTPWPRRSRRRSRRAVRAPATRSPRRPGCSWPSARCCPTAPGTRWWVRRSRGRRLRRTWPTSRTPTRSTRPSASCSRTSPRTTSSSPKFQKANTIVQYQYREPGVPDHRQADRGRGRPGGLRRDDDGARGRDDHGRRHRAPLLARQGERDRRARARADEGQGPGGEDPQARAAGQARLPALPQQLEEPGRQDLLEAA